METQWIAFAGLTLVLIGGVFLMFRDPPKKSRNNTDDERLAGPNGGTSTDD